jgi:hypothetical protein
VQKRKEVNKKVHLQQEQEQGQQAVHGQGAPGAHDVDAIKHPCPLLQGKGFLLVMPHPVHNHYHQYPVLASR